MSPEDNSIDPKLTARLESLRHAMTRVKNMISLHHIHTYGEALLQIGLTEWEGVDKSKGVTLGEDLDNLFDAIEFHTAYTWGQVEDHPPVIEPTIPRETLTHRRLLEIYKPSPKQKCVLYEFQRRYSVALYHILFKSTRDDILEYHEQNRDINIRAINFTSDYGGVKAVAANSATGTGKTFIVGQMLRWALDEKYAEKVQSLSPMPYVYVTKASIVEQTKRVLREQFGIDTATEVLVTNYDQMRANFGEWFVEEQVKIEYGEEHVIWKWKPFIHPCILILDEFQAVKNLDSTQSKIFQAFNEINDPNIKMIVASATLWTRVCESKVFAVATRHNISIGLGQVPLSNLNFTDWAKRIASPAEPEEYSPGAVNRLMKELAPYIVTVKGVRSKFHAKNSVRLIDFENEEDREYYMAAFKRYLEEKAKIEGSEVANSSFLMLVASMKFRQAAEICRARFLAREMWENVYKHGCASVIAACFQHTIAKITMILTQDYGVPRDKISLIWGGSAAFRGASEKYSPEEIKEILQNMFTGRQEYPSKVLKEISQQLQAESMGLAEIPEGLRLGPQSRPARQEEIDRFQRGNSLFCAFTFKAGGIGLSLHHTDDLTQFKCRKTPAGWPIDEDIPKVPTRPRRSWLTPVWSALEMVQGLGRVPRLTSLSDSQQEVVFYRGTEEEKVAYVVSHKLKCLREVVRQKEKWEDIILGVKERAIYEVEEEDDEGSSPTDNVDMFDEDEEDTSEE